VVERGGELSLSALASSEERIHVVEGSAYLRPDIEGRRLLAGRSRRHPVIENRASRGLRAKTEGTPGLARA
jgi:hypothetical protein